MNRTLNTKILRITYLIIILWIMMGLLAIVKSVNFEEIAVYFVSLSGFAAAYVFGETKRPSHESALFMSGVSSSREKMMYYIIAIWSFFGVVGIAQQLNLIQMASYFAALTPFVSAYIIGETFKPEIPVINQEPEVIPEPEVPIEITDTESDK